MSALDPTTLLTQFGLAGVLIYIVHNDLGGVKQSLDQLTAEIQKDLALMQATQEANKVAETQIHA